LRNSSSLSFATPNLSTEYRLPRFIPQLDRLRGLAILMVLIQHAEAVVPSFLDGVAHQMWIGVDLFFVLSGFLITGILWDTRDSKNYYGRFYVRRILRIWPAYIILLFFAFVFMPLLKRMVGGLVLEIPKERLGLWAYLLMIQNLFPKSLSNSSILLITWSLAIEEQFYLVWPTVIRYVSQSALIPCLFAGFLFAPVIRICAMRHAFSQLTIYYNPLTHGDGLLCGALIALWLRKSHPKRRTLILTGVALLVVGLTLFLMFPPNNVVRQYCSPLVFTAAAVLSSGLLLVALVSENTGRFLHRFFFMNHTLAFLGFISYSLYLFHFLFVRFGVSEKLLARFDRWHHPLITHSSMLMCAFGSSVLLAWLSRVTIERAALSRKGPFVNSTTS
jgi:peptidoglycan/LPS O-acetylase OafA/YrhL